MRVLHVTHQYPPAIGGSERYIADISEELARRGHQVDVLTSRSLDYHSWRNELGPFEVRNGVNVRRFRSIRRHKYVWQLLKRGIEGYVRTRARRYEALFFLGGGPLCPGMFTWLLAHASRYDLVHLNCLVYAPAAYGYAAARLRGVPAVVTPHAHSEQEVTYDFGYQRAVLRGSDHVLAVTTPERTFLMDVGIDARHITTAGNGLRPEEYPAQNAGEARRRLGLPEDAFVLLFLGRKTDYKGFDLVVEAFKTLQPDHPELRLLAVGPGTQFSDALLARNSGLPGLVDLGAVSDEVKLAALNACDCLALPSSAEAFGIVFLEAWILGKPVIGARTLAVSTVIADGEDGFLVTPGDVPGLAAQVACLLADPGLARQMGLKGHAKVLGRYTVERVTDVVEGVYLRVLRQRRSKNSGAGSERKGPAGE